MPNRKLSETELHDLFRPLLDQTRVRLRELSGDDEKLHCALRRKLAKELSYDERGKPGERKQLKAYKRGEQRGKCAECGHELPKTNAVLDRIEAMAGYTPENTRLICRECDFKIQSSRGFA
jgi:ribosomal protein L44E